MGDVSPHRVVAVILFAIAILTLAASRALPFLVDIPGAVQAAIVVVGVVCVVVGVRLWLRKTSDMKE